MDKQLTKNELIKQQSEEIQDSLINIDFLKQELKRQIDKRKFAQQTRNWVIILTILGHLIYWIW